MIAKLLVADICLAPFCVDIIVGAEALSWTFANLYHDRDRTWLFYAAEHLLNLQLSSHRPPLVSSSQNLSRWTLYFIYTRNLMNKIIGCFWPWSPPSWLPSFKALWARRFWILRGESVLLLFIPWKDFRVRNGASSNQRIHYLDGASGLDWETIAAAYLSWTKSE